MRPWPRRRHEAAPSLRIAAGTAAPLPLEGRPKSRLQRCKHASQWPQDFAVSVTQQSIIIPHAFPVHARTARMLTAPNRSTRDACALCHRRRRRRPRAKASGPRSRSLLLLSSDLSFRSARAVGAWSMVNSRWTWHLHLRFDHGPQTGRTVHSAQRPNAPQHEPCRGGEQLACTN